MNNNQESLLRSHIRSVIKFAKQKQNKTINEEYRLRKLIQKLILEVAAEKVELDPHEFTGINVLRDLFKNSNLLSTLRQTYLTLTTSPDQRKSFRAHILNWVIDTLEPIQASDKASLNEEVVDIDVITDDERNKFIDADDGSGEESEFTDKAKQDAEAAAEDDDEEEGYRELEGQDTTGRNKANQVYNNIETSIVDSFSSLDDQQDQEIYKRWMLANLKLYFDKWEKGLDPKLKEPSSPEYDKSKQDSPEEAPAEEPATKDPAPEDVGINPEDMEIPEIP